MIGCTKEHKNDSEVKKISYGALCMYQIYKFKEYESIFRHHYLET